MRRNANATHRKLEAVERGEDVCEECQDVTSRPGNSVLAQENMYINLETTPAEKYRRRRE